MDLTDLPAITGIVFSRDRALQLDGALRSFFRHCRDPEHVSLKVIYAGSSKLWLNQYGQLQHEFPTVDFLAQGNFERDVFSLIGIPFSRWGRFVLRLGLTTRPANKYVLFLVDDNIFVRDFCLSDMISALCREEEALGFALHLGRNLNYCYPLDILLKFPTGIPVFGDVIKYRWPDAGDGLNYPLEVSSSLYRLGDIARLLAGLGFSDPNTLEGRMAVHATSFRRSRPCLLCYAQSVTFCNPLNRVQRVCANRAGAKQEYSAGTLARLFEQGYRVDAGGYDGFTTSSCHQEVELLLSKPE